MSLNKIDGSSVLPSAYRDQPQGVDRKVRPPLPEVTTAAEAPAAGRKPKPKVADVAEISTGAREMADLQAALDAGRSALDRVPDRREDLLAQVRERLATGFYNSSEVIDTVAARIAPVIRDMDNP
jgi:hypothetical protein